VKTRKQLESILRSFENSVSKKIFAEREDIWPHSHADLQKTVYSSPEIQKSIEEVLLGEFCSAMSGTEVPALSFSLIQNSKTKYKINKHFIQLKLQTP
jgi:hypothetical protein